MFFSIIVPTYNRASLIEKTISLIQAQLFTDWECVVIDDGSTDSTKQVVEEIIKGDSRVKYFYQENKERSAARNNGYAHSKGQYVIFLDSDDAFESDYLQELHAFIKAQSFPEALIVSDYCIWDGEKTTKVNIPKVYDNAAEWLFDYPVSPSRACVHRDIMINYQFREDIVIVEDSVLWVSILNKYPLLRFDQHKVWYRVHDGNSVNPHTDSSQYRLAGLKLFFKDSLSNSLRSEFKKKVLSDCYFSIAQYFKVREEKLKSFSSLIKSIACKPNHEQTKAKLFMILCLLPYFERWWHARKSQ